MDPRREMIEFLRKRLDEAEREAKDYLAKHPQPPSSPYHVNVSSYSEIECLKKAEECYNLWLPVLSRDLQRAAESGINVSSDKDWREISFAIASKFTPAFVKSSQVLLESRVSSKIKVPTKWWPFQNSGIRGYNNLCTIDYGFDAAVERRLLSEFIGGIWNAHFMTIVGSPILGRTPQGWDEFIYAALHTNKELSLATGKREHLLLEALMSRALAKRCEQATHERDETDIKTRNSLGLFAVLEELPLLARRDGVVAKRYGESAIETYFEAQLAILMQSLGFLVIRTERAQRRIDLVCIAPGAAGESYTILLEAKTTAANYSLPTKDSRAITEYVSSVRSALKSLPPLRVVIIVGNTPAKTVAGKLAALEATCGLPVRYCEASLLRRLRRQLPGPVDYARFLKVCIEASRILGEQEVYQVIESDKAIRDAHNNFVQTLLARNST